MSIKNLFDSNSKNRKFVSQKSDKEAFKNVESSENLKQISKKQERFVPDVDFSEPSNFVNYGSAYLYYKGAMEHIFDYYPYDGSSAEINDYLNNLLDVEKYVFDNLYPRTNGYALISANGWGTLNGSINGNLVIF